MNGKKLLTGLSYIDHGYIEESEFDAFPEKGEESPSRQKGGRKYRKLLLIAAVVTAMTVFMGAAVFSRWSDSMQKRYNPSEDAKQQAQKSGLSVLYEDSASDGGSVLTATDQGITVSLVQSVVDQSKAQIVLRVEGFTPEEDHGVRPNVWMEVPATLDGEEHFWVSRTAEFDDGITRNLDGEWVYGDGTAVEENQDGWQKGRYVKEDGSLELVLFYYFQDTSGVNLGKEIQLHFTGFGTTTDTGKAASTSDKMVEGSWDLRWVLEGSDNAIRIEPNVRLSDNVTLLEAEIGQVTIKTLYQTDTYWDGWETLESLSPGLAGIQLKDGTMIQCHPAGEGYQDLEGLIYFVESTTFQGMVDLEQAESLVYYDGWELDDAGNPTIPVYRYIPIS